MKGFTCWRMMLVRTARCWRSYSSRQRFLQHGHAGPVPREKDRAGFAESAPARGDIQTDERLAGSWHPRHEDDGLLMPGPGVLDDLLDGP